MSGSVQTQVPELTDGAVLLRALRDDDLDAVVEQSRDEVVQRWSLTVPSSYARADAEEFLVLAHQGWASGERWQWAVEVDGRFAGLVDLRHCGEGVREIGFAAHPATRGRGHLTRASRLVVAYAFSAGCPLVLWHAAAGNVASRRVAWHAGFSIAPGETRIVRDGVRRASWSGTLAAGDPLTPTTPWVRPPPLQAAAGRVALRLRAWHEDDAGGLPPRPAGEHRPGVVPGSHSPAIIPSPDSYAAWHAAVLAREAAGELLSWVVTADTHPGTHPHPDPDPLLGGVQLAADGSWAAHGSAVVSGWLTPGARGRGLALAALDAVLTHALTSTADGGLGLARVEARVAADDRAAVRLLRRAGLHDVGPTGPTGAAGLVLEVRDDDERRGRAVEPLVVPTLETARLRLRPYRDEDVPGADDGPDEASRRFLPVGAHPDAAHYPAWLARQRRRADAGEAIAWCVADRSHDRALGYLGVFRMGPQSERFDAEVGYYLVPGARGHGYVAEALEAAVGHAFTAVADGGLGLTRLHAGTDAHNHASQASLERAGFRRWGADRQAWRRADGTLSDGAHFELLATDDRLDRRPRGRRLHEVTLEGDQVRLRPWRAGDAARVVTACSHPTTWHWLAGLPRPYRLEHALDYIASAHTSAAAGEELKLAVAGSSHRSTDQDGVLLGAVSLMHLRGATPGLAEVGYWTHPDARGRGVMTQAVQLAVRHAFAPVEDGGLGLRRLVLRAAAGNTASQRVAARAGFVVTGRQRRAEQLGDGTWDDLVDHDLLADDWTARPT